MINLSEIKYKNDFVRNFPGDESGDLSSRQTPGVLFSKAIPSPVMKPELIAWSDDFAKELGIRKPEGQKDIDILAGNLITDSMYPYAACYAGHQFGHWAGQLGDGRAISLGEKVVDNGLSWELQLKGAGPTAYSRRADGRAVLRSSLREYLISEAMHYLGVPTTRALSLVKTGNPILRDMFYDGNPEYEPGAIVMRAAPSFLRFGSFEMPAARGETENLQRLVNWTIESYYPHISGKNKIIQWFREVVERTAHMVVEWQRVGFVHGVMNSDNMSILGLTIDYGPFSFVDDYDPDFTPNTTDLPGRRYAFGKQLSVAHWNLSCLANALLQLVSKEELIEALNSFEPIVSEKYYRMMANKLGLDHIKQEDGKLIAEFEKVLSRLGPDMTIFYQLLIDLNSKIENEQELLTHFGLSFYKEPDPSQVKSLFNLIKNYQRRLENNPGTREDSKMIMRKANPRFILRNYLLHQAIEELEMGEDQLFRKLEGAIKDPYSKSNDKYFVKRPDWASKKAGCSMLSCSS